jgi:hypothetical protein
MNVGGMRELFAHPQWDHAFKEHMAERLAQYRNRNDAEDDPQKVLRNQGAIAEIKYWMALDKTIASLVQSPKTERKQ